MIWHNESSSIVVRSLLTIVFGALPATWLGLFAAMGVWIGFVMLFANLMSLDFIGLLTSFLITVWGAFGLYGAIALWAVSFGFVNTFSLQGLVAGLLAAFPLVMFVVLAGDIGLSELMVLGPTIVGAAWLVRTHVSVDTPDFDNELERDLAELRRRGTSW